MTVYFAIGRAGEEKIKSMAQAIINSSNVMPAAERESLGDRPFIRMLRGINNPFDYGWTCSVASLVTSGISFCCESFAFTCTIERLDEPGPSALMTIPIHVPLPLTPRVFGSRGAAM